MMFRAGRWQQLTMTERWLILNGLVELQRRRRGPQRRGPIHVQRLVVKTGPFNLPERPKH
ncbi:MAG: hypothetical protein K6T78_02915 [Alicyclobacillus sp.]|nr:hypothetical protein [Alicyclobacillus sp.]